MPPPVSFYTKTKPKTKRKTKRSPALAAALRQLEESRGSLPTSPRSGGRTPPRVTPPRPRGSNLPGGPTSSGGITPAEARRISSNVRKTKRAASTRNRGPGVGPNYPGIGAGGPSWWSNIPKGADAIGEALETVFTPWNSTDEDIKRAGNVLLGSSITKAITEGKFDPGGLAIDAALLFGAPRGTGALIGRGASGAVRTARRGARIVKLNNSSIQFFSSPSTITRFGQNLIDRASEMMTGRVGALREADSKIAQITGQALTPLSARGRVPKQAARRLRQEQGRARAARSGEIDLIKDIGGGSTRFTRPVERPERTAFFYEAQLPAGMRGGSGLRQIRDDLKRELQTLTPERIAADPTRPAALQNELKKLDKAIVSSRRYDERSLDAARALMDDRTDIFIAAGRLAPETAAERTSLLTRRLVSDSVVPTDEIYVGHRPGTVRGGKRMGPGGVAVGKTMLPQGVNQQNTLSLYRQGRLRTDPDVIVEDWQAAQGYAFNNAAKDDLARMGEPIDPNVGPKEGYILINPQGHKIPRSWRTNESDMLPGEGFNPDDMISDLDEYINNYMIGYPTPNPTKVREAVTKMAAKDPLYTDLKQVPKDVVSRYFSQLIDPKIVITHPFLENPGRVGKTMDAANDILYMSLIYSNPGYIPSNLAGNLALNAVHAGAFAPFNLIRAGQLLAFGPKTLRRQVLNEVGQGPTSAIASSFLKKPARIVSRIPDDAPRVAAFLHEAARAKVISKVKPGLTTADYQKLQGLFRPQNRELLNDISQAANEAMVRFDTLTNFEKAFARRMLFVWPWIHGATRYPFRFAVDHPLRSIAMGVGAYAYMEREGSPFMGDQPPWLKFAVQTGESVVDGKTYPSVFNTGPVSPIATAFETMSSLAAEPGARTFSEFLNPGLRAAYSIGQKETSYGGEAEGGYSEAALQNLERIAPNVGLAQDLINPPEGGMYPEDETRLGRLKRASRVLPYAVDPEEARAAAEREGTVEAPPHREEPRAYEEIYKWATAVPTVIPEDAIPDVETWKRGQDMIRYGKQTLARQLELMRDSDPDTPAVSKLTERQEYAVAIGVLAKIRPDYLPVDWKDYYAKVWESKDDKAIDTLKEAINTGLTYADTYGASLPYRLKKLRESRGE